MNKFLTLSLTSLTILSLNAQANITFTGDVDADFSATANCYEDDRDVGIVTGMSRTGWDIQRLCFHYDGNDDVLYVGIKAYDGAIFGDADGDGDPANSSIGGVLDLADLSGTESFVLSIDLDGDSESDGFNFSTVDVLIGVSDAGSIANFGVYEPDVGYTLSNPNSSFGAKLPINIDIFANPDATNPDFEFSIPGFTAENLGVTSLADKPAIQFFAGSTDDAGVGDDFLPTVGEGESYPLYDGDEDGLKDFEELEQGTDPEVDDTDGDGVNDGVEINGQNPSDPLDSDSDDDGLLDGEEDANGNGVIDEGETDPNNSDTDGDGLTDGTEVNSSYPTDAAGTGSGSTDPLNPDTDGDGLLDGEEDTNSNGSFESTSGETNPILADTDGGGVNDKIEKDNGFNPNDASDDAQAEEVAVQTGAGLGFNQLQGSGLNCNLQKTSKSSSQKGFWFLLMTSAFSILMLRKKKLKSE